MAKAYACRDRYTGADRDATLYFSGADRLVLDAGRVQPGQASYTNTGPTPTSYSRWFSIYY